MEAIPTSIQQCSIWHLKPTEHLAWIARLTRCLMPRNLRNRTFMTDGTHIIIRWSLSETKLASPWTVFSLKEWCHKTRRSLPKQFIFVVIRGLNDFEARTCQQWIHIKSFHVLAVRLEIPLSQVKIMTDGGPTNSEFPSHQNTRKHRSAYFMSYLISILSFQARRTVQQGASDPGLNYARYTKEGILLVFHHILASIHIPNISFEVESSTWALHSCISRAARRSSF